MKIIAKLEGQAVDPNAPVTPPAPMTDPALCPPAVPAVPALPADPNSPPPPAPAPEQAPTPTSDEELDALSDKEDEEDEAIDARLCGGDGGDDDRIDCPFCGHMHYPGTETALLDEWMWEGDVCSHTLFVALDLSSFSGFEFRSKLCKQLLGLPDSDDWPAEEADVEAVIKKISLPGLQLRSYSDDGGVACGPCGGGLVTFGFAPDQAQV